MAEIALSIDWKRSPFICSIVSCGSELLVLNTDFTGNFYSVAMEALELLPETPKKFVLRNGKCSVCFLNANGLTYCVVAFTVTGPLVPLYFLVALKEEFEMSYGAGGEAIVDANRVTEEFGGKLKLLMYQCLYDPNEGRLTGMNLLQGVRIDDIEKVTGKDFWIKYVHVVETAKREEAIRFNKAIQARKDWMRCTRNVLVSVGGCGLLAGLYWLTKKKF